MHMTDIRMTMKQLIIPILLLAIPVLTVPLFAAEETLLLRYPAWEDGRIAFVYAGNIYTVPETGGVARRLTSGAGNEWLPRFSPDGKWIAFTADYDGNTDVYVMQSTGGEPQRLTWHPGTDLVVDWSPDSREVLFRSSRESVARSYKRLYRISREGGNPVAVPLPRAELASFSPDGKQLAYNRRGREFRTWKRYQGGTAQDIWLYDFEQETLQQLTDWIGTDAFPMWAGDDIYFISDREHTLNLFVHHLGNGEKEQLTRFDEYDVKWPCAGDRGITFENGGKIYLYHFDNGRLEQPRIVIREDRVETRPHWKKVSREMRSWTTSPSGKRVVVEAHGDLFTVPQKHGETRNLTGSPGIHERSPAWSPDGRRLAFFTDASGEYQLVLRDMENEEDNRYLVKMKEDYPWWLQWSPDSRYLLYGDGELRLQLVEAATGKVTTVDRGLYHGIYSFNWSPDSRWIIYTRDSENGFGSLFVYAVAEKESHRLTGDFTNEQQGVFDDSSQCIYFSSSRIFHPDMGGYENDYTFSITQSLYALPLQADQETPFAPRSDEAVIKSDDDENDGDDDDEESDDAEDEDNDDDEEDSDDAEDEDNDDEEVPETVIDFENIEARVQRVPLTPGRFGRLAVLKGNLYYMSYPVTPGPLDFDEEKMELHRFDLREEEDEVVAGNVRGYTLTPDGEQIVARIGRQLVMFSAQGKPDMGEDELSLADLEMLVDPREEWQEIFTEAWRIEREFFYDEEMHGVNWQRMKTRYEKLLPYVSHRSDLNYLIGEMIGELNCGHAYVFMPDKFDADHVDVGMLGAQVEPAANGYFRITKIFRKLDWNDPDSHAPLAAPAVNVREGEYIMAVNGEQLHADENFYSWFQNLAGKDIKLKVSSSGSEEDSREVVVTPISDESHLYYTEWVAHNRDWVTEQSDGRVGYLHVPNTSYWGIMEF
ncbi:MAG: PDZ domain-containing protein, partial [Pirellulales bacterium]|nr:PDZ domain-containing protein [Pirellulales bacterium]